jgi:glucan endo-1,3-alpha-glucosidase
VGNSYPYTLSDWTEDILAAQGYGIDGFALNLGSDEWQPARIADAYAAAAAIAANNTAKKPFKLFFSFDMTCLSDPGLITNYIREYHGHICQFVYQGKDFVSTFSGEYVTFGLPTANQGWQVKVKDVLAADGIYIYFVPQWSAFAPTGVFAAQPVIDGMLCWTAWFVLD